MTATQGQGACPSWMVSVAGKLTNHRLPTDTRLVLPALSARVSFPVPFPVQPSHPTYVTFLGPWLPVTLTHLAPVPKAVVSLETCVL